MVEAPSSKTSNSSSPEKKSRMEESEFKEEEEGEATKHREIEFSQGLPVRGSERNR